MVTYEQALKAWGAHRLNEYRGDNPASKVMPETVQVTFDFDEGYSCGCGGADPMCYCSLAESPHADVLVTGRLGNDKLASLYISIDDFDFATVLREIVVAGGGTITL